MNDQLSLVRMEQGADFSKDRKYRFLLWRIWNESKPKVMFIGLNPSTADEKQNDNTIKKVIKIAENNGYGGVYMMNCFPLVSTDPKVLSNYYKPGFDEGNDAFNRYHIVEYSKKCRDVVFAWGNFKEAEIRGRTLARLINNPLCITQNKNGSPKHPLYCLDNSVLKPFKRPE